MSAKHYIVSFIGNITRDPILKHLDGGKSAITVSVAINDSYTNNKGVEIKKVTYYDYQAYGDAADRIAALNYQKGDEMIVTGDSPTDNVYNNAKGEPGVTHVINFGTIKRNNPKRDNGDYKAAESVEETVSTEDVKPKKVDDSDMPF